MVSLNKSEPSKPDFVNAIKHINNSSHKNFVINASEKRKLNKIFSNYFEHLNLAKKSDLKLLRDAEIESYQNNFWIVCYKDISIDGCNVSTPLKNKDYKVIEEVNFYLVDIKLVKLI